MEAAISYGEKAKRLGVEIHMNKKVTDELIKEVNPNEVIIAIGAEPICLPIPGADGKQVYQSHDVLNGMAEMKGHCVVIGGGLVGVETAEYL